MASVGEITYPIMRGMPDIEGISLDHHARKGEDGIEDRQIGLRTENTTLETVATYAYAAAGQAAIESEKDLQGTIVAVVDAHGTTYSNVVIIAVKAAMASIRNPVGEGVLDTDTVMVRSTWTVRRKVEF